METKKSPIGSTGWHDAGWAVFCLSVRTKGPPVRGVAMPAAANHKAGKFEQES
jgi:hypothetical protein